MPFGLIATAIGSLFGQAHAASVLSSLESQKAGLDYMANQDKLTAQSFKLQDKLAAMKDTANNKALTATAQAGMFLTAQNAKVNVLNTHYQIAGNFSKLMGGMG